jgi:hypothetical protein
LDAFFSVFIIRKNLFFKFKECLTYIRYVKHNIKPKKLTFYNKKQKIVLKKEIKYNKFVSTVFEFKIISKIRQIDGQKIGQNQNSYLH